MSPFNNCSLKSMDYYTDEQDCLLEYGQDIQNADVEAVNWYLEAADQGDAEAQYNLGLMFKYGWGVHEDPVEAVNWLREAAYQGHSSAQYNIALMYDKGRGIEQDFDEAAKWYRKAANQGDADALYNLGVIHGKGLFIHQDHSEAIKEEQKTADQFHLEIQNDNCLPVSLREDRLAILEHISYIIECLSAGVTGEAKSELGILICKLEKMGGPDKEFVLDNLKEGASCLQDDKYKYAGTSLTRVARFLWKKIIP